MTALDQSPASPVPPGDGAGRTTVPSRPPARTGQAPRVLDPIRTADVLAVVGALAAALATTGLLWTELAPFTGALGYVVVTWCLFVVIYSVLVSFDENRPGIRDRVAAVVVHSLAVVVVAALAFIVAYPFWHGFKALVHLNFYTQDMHSTGPLDPLKKGGVLHAMVGTLIEVGIALIVAVPLGLLAAVFMNE